MYRIKHILIYFIIYVFVLHESVYGHMNAVAERGPKRAPYDLELE